MQTNPIKILAIESSCDETAVAVIEGANYKARNNNQETRYKQISNTKLQIQNLSAPVVLSNIVSSQVRLHAKTGGVVPEVASRAHIESIIPVIEEALIKANLKFKIQNLKFNLNSKLKIENLFTGITHIAVTVGPGLVGSLLVGYNTAKALAYALNIPIVPINHIEGHIYSAVQQNRITNNQETMNKQVPNYKPQTSNPGHVAEVNTHLRDVNSAFAEQFKISNLKFSNNSQNSKSQTLNPSHLAGVNAHLRGDYMDPVSNNLEPDQFPVLALTVSGGHTSLTLMTDHGVYETIGQTRDDAAGEAFDKVAKLLNLGYPGGPAVSKLAQQFRNRITNNQDTRYKQISNVNINYQIASQQVSTSTSSTGSPQTRSLRQAQGKQGSPSISSGQASQRTNGQQLKAESSRMFPRPMINDESFDFSFSGLKTAVLNRVKELTANNYKLTASDKQSICYEFEEAVVDVLLSKTQKAIERFRPRTVVVAGGVSANSRLRDKFSKELSEYHQKSHLTGVNAHLRGDEKSRVHNSKGEVFGDLRPATCDMHFPPMEMTGDNAAMIGLAAYFHVLRGDVKKWNEIALDSNLKL